IVTIVRVLVGVTEMMVMHVHMRMSISLVILKDG
ncbi:hypothetical protein PSYAR_24477, partial [Pseudomonas syringae pv. aceris str. M302273]